MSLDEPRSEESPSGDAGPDRPDAPPPVPAEAFYAAFRDAPSEFGPLPFWFWNAAMEESELLRQLEAFKQAGCAGAIIYPRHGLRTPYFSDEWFRLVRLVAIKARDLKLQLWLADSENWPGGIGPAPTEAWYLKAARHNATGETLHSFNVGGEVAAVAAFPRPEDGGPVDPGGVVDLTGNVQAGRLEWRPPDARAWDLLIFSAYRYDHVDLLADGAGQRLLDSTHARYEASLGDLFEAGITGFFSDDLALVSVWNVPDPEALPWSPALAKDLAAVGPLLPILLALAAETADAGRLRQQYWACVANRYLNQFFEPVRKWMKERKLEWAGHLLFEEPLLAQVLAQADFPRMVRQFSRPVVDNLALRPAGQEQNLTASSAHQAGLPAATESFGGAGWGLDLAARRRCFDAQVARGIDRLIPHGVFYSSAGKRKAENPPSEFLREPFAPLYPSFAGHVRRLSWAMSQGRSTAPIALLYPLRSVWASMKVTEDPELARAVEDDFARVTRLLEDTHYEFTILDEEALEHAEISGDRLRAAGGLYPVLVIPSCPFLSRAAWDRAIELFENGGKVLCLGMLPEGFEDGPDPSMPAALLRLAAVEVGMVRDAYLLRGRGISAGHDVYTFTRKHPSGGRFYAFQAGMSLDEEFSRGEVRQILNACAPPDVECRDPQFLARRRSLGGMDVYWIVSTASETFDARLALRSHGAPEIWNAATGERRPILQYSWVGSDQTVVTVRLHPGEGVLIAVPPEESAHLEAANFVLESVRAAGAGIVVEGYDDPSRAVAATSRLAGPAQAVWKRGRETINVAGPPAVPFPSLSLNDGWEFHRQEANVLVLDEWKFRRDERGGGRILLWHRRLHPDWDTLPPRQVLSWFPEPEPLEKEISSYVWYQAAFNIQEWRPGAALWAVLERTDAPYRCWVDGEEIDLLSGAGRPSPCPNLSLDDPGFDWIDLAPFASSGHHHLTLLGDCKGIAPHPATNRQRIPLDLVPAPARLVGDFAVQDRPRGRAVTVREPAAVSVGSWTRFGYPHYSGAALFRREVTVPASYQGARIFLECEECATVINIRVNGSDAGAAPWAPFRFEITDSVQPGQPAVLELVVRNTRANALIGREDASGLIGGIKLAAYRPIRFEFTHR